MGSNSGSNGGGGRTGPQELGLTTRKSSVQKGVEKVGDFIKGGGILGSVVRGVTTGIKKSKQNVLDYEGQAAGVTPMRSPMTTGRDGGDGGGAMGTSGQVVQAPQPVGTPTTVEVSQSESVNAADSALLRSKKIKYRGRSVTINTSPTGAVGSLTLGKPSLLGR
jgi:hypothetical protein